eukprot:CAMPEP_0172705052 /NCGR_PEP_ID=MMETSP1074-20121228/42169_1 /TAXON_ID=2916 /ORGANISM="Ceratium fusus, Strain PA161109" /LENGTH=57 /DNA_ID=CAMNT_0013527323 /DNA_START=115 /DNA_END=285 /DNA_ORIENTATION=+
MAVLQRGNTFIASVAPRFDEKATAGTVAGAAAAMGLASPAGAFVYDGKEYFDIWFGI